MLRVGEERAEGISGSRTDGRQDIENLIYRAETAKDYDVIVIQSYDRLTRGGADHGGYLLFRFAQLGVRIISATNDIPDNEYAPLLRDIEFIKAQGTGRSISLHTLRGATASFFDGRCSYARTPPYGIDRMILSATGTKLYRIRNLTDGTQQKLNWDSDNIIEKYGRNPKKSDPNKGSLKHFQKHVDHRIVLVPGAPEAVEAVTLMYDMFWVRGIGVTSIARTLTERGLPPMRGGVWNQCSVYCIVHNPIYVQKGIANRYASGLYHNRPTKKGDEPLRAKNGVGRWTYRPQSDWIITHHPDIQIIPDELRQSIWEQQLEKFVKRAEGEKKVYKREALSKSAWPLLGSIWDKETGKAMASHRCGPEAAHRYYFVAQHRTNPVPGTKGKKKFFPAEAVEKAVIESLSVVLGEADEYVPLLERFADEGAKALSGDFAILTELLAERDRLREKKAFMAEELDDLGPELLKKKMAPVTAKIRSLDERIALAEQITGTTPTDAKGVVRSVVRQMKDVTGLLSEPSSATLRSVLKVFTKTTVDLEAREAEVEVRLPEEAMLGKDALIGLCATSSVARNPRHLTQDENPIFLAKFRCKRKTVKRHPCLVCTRQRGAAPSRLAA
jgi:hypothetical protein